MVVGNLLEDQALLTDRCFEAVKPVNQVLKMMVTHDASVLNHKLRI